jgi:hypothetical protein
MNETWRQPSPQWEMWNKRELAMSQKGTLTEVRFHLHLINPAPHLPLVPPPAPDDSFLVFLGYKMG